MTINVSSNFETMTLVSEYFLEAFPSGTFYWKKNCEETEHSISISSKLVSLDVPNTIEIDASELFPSRTTFEDGVYSIRVVVSGQDAILIEDVETLVEGLHEETYCLFIGTTTNCKALKSYLETEDEVLEYLIKALQIANDCDCDCEDSCVIYEALLDRINNPITSTNDNKDCGCS